LLRRLSAWIVCATSSLPVPVSPEISTPALVRATLPISSYTLCICSDAPISGPRRSPASAFTAARSRSFAGDSCGASISWEECDPPSILDSSLMKARAKLSGGD
jgi:hypothetical protein